MPKKVTREQRESILRLLREGQDRDTIAAVVGVTPGQVSAVSAHVKMGTYALPEIPVGDAVGEGLGSASPLTECVRDLEAVRSAPGVSPILLGKDAETEELVC